MVAPPALAVLAGHADWHRASYRLGSSCVLPALFFISPSSECCPRVRHTGSPACSIKPTLHVYKTVTFAPAAPGVEGRRTHLRLLVGLFVVRVVVVQGVKKKKKRSLPLDNMCAAVGKAGRAV